MLTVDDGGLTDAVEREKSTLATLDMEVEVGTDARNAI